MYCKLASRSFLSNGSVFEGYIPRYSDRNVFSHEMASFEKAIVHFDVVSEFYSKSVKSR